MSVFSFSARVSYDDVDSNMRMNLRGAMGYMQEAAMLHSGQAGYSVADVERTRVTWMLVQWRVRLMEPAYWGDALTIHTWPRSMERVTSVRNFEVFGPNDVLAAIGESNWVLVNADTGRITRITPNVAAAYDLTDRDVFDTPLPEIVSCGGECTWSGVVGLRDIDTNNHVNNRVYLDYAREALREEFAHISFREVSVRYRKQLLLGDRIHCLYRCEGNRHMVDICGESGVVHGTVIFLT